MDDGGPPVTSRLDGDAAEFDNDRTLIVANHESFLDGLLLVEIIVGSAIGACP